MSNLFLSILYKSLFFRFFKEKIKSFTALIDSVLVSYKKLICLEINFLKTKEINKNTILMAKIIRNNCQLIHNKIKNESKKVTSSLNMLK